MAQKAGGLQFMMPEGCTIETTPADLMHAIQHACMVLGWQENLQNDEMPPSWMWPFHDELEIWFDEVEARRKQKYGALDDDREQVPMTQNEYAREFYK